MKRTSKDTKKPYVKGSSRSAFLKKMQAFTTPFVLVLETPEGGRKKMATFWERSEKNVDALNKLLRYAKKRSTTEVSFIALLL